MNLKLYHSEAAFHCCSLMAVLSFSVFLSLCLSCLKMEFGDHSSVTVDQHSSFIFLAIDIHIHIHQPLDKGIRKVHVYDRITITLLHVNRVQSSAAGMAYIGSKSLPSLDMTESKARTYWSIKLVSPNNNTPRISRPLPGSQSTRDYLTHPV